MSGGGGRRVEEEEEEEEGRKGIVSAGPAARMMREQKREREGNERVMEIKLWKKFHASVSPPRCDITVLNVESSVSVPHPTPGVSC